MSTEWVPDAAGEEMERLMEEMELPESDRDQVRRFAEVLRRRKRKVEGAPLPPIPEGMKKWILGES